MDILPPQCRSQHVFNLEKLLSNRKLQHCVVEVLTDLCIAVWDDMNRVMHNSKNCSIGNLIQEKSPCTPHIFTASEYASNPQTHSNLMLILVWVSAILFYAKLNTVFKSITSDKHAICINLESDIIKENCFR